MEWKEMMRTISVIIRTKLILRFSLSLFSFTDDDELGEIKDFDDDTGNETRWEERQDSGMGL